MRTPFSRDPARLPRRLAPTRDERGYTLSELLIVMAILSVVLAALASVFVSSTKAEVDQNRRFHAQQEVRLALDQLRREGHCARRLHLASASRITLTFGAHCRTGADPDTATILAGGTSSTATTITVGSAIGAFPATTPFHVIAGAETMRVTGVSGTTWTVQRSQLGTAAPVAGHPTSTTVRLAYAVTWCTSGAGTRWALRRIEGDPASCAGGKVVADYLNQGNVFTLTPQSPTRLATLGVLFPASVDGSTRVYRLQDIVVLRNGDRS